MPLLSQNATSHGRLIGTIRYEQTASEFSSHFWRAAKFMLWWSMLYYLAVLAKNMDKVHKLNVQWLLRCIHSSRDFIERHWAMVVFYAYV